MSHLASPKRGFSFALTIILLVLGSLGSCLAADAPAEKSPGVLVLVLNGLGPSDQVSINYSTDIPIKEATDDVNKLAEQTRWIVKDTKVTSAKGNVPGARETTSSSFSVTPLVNHAEGTLPVEPFVVLLKRFGSIQINYLVSDQFGFRGLEDFEDDYVKIKLSKSGNSYLYRIKVKDSGFEVLNLPRKQSEVPAEQPNQGMPARARTMLILGMAIAAAVIAYIVAILVAKKRQSR